MKNLRIIFMGTPEFAVASLKALVETNHNIVGVITNPDKPAGRGQKIKKSEVKKYAIEKKLHILQPEKLKNSGFIEQLKKLKADLQIVIAFRMLPEVVWNMPQYGTFNLHASLLPQYRGAAPINWAIINGEKKTGATTFFIEHKIDTGKIIFHEEVPILANETAGELHDKLMVIGAKLVLKTVESIWNNSFPQIDQASMINNSENLKPAPKINKEDCKIKWDKNILEVYNFIRGLSPYPGAWSEILSLSNKKLFIKIFQTEIIRKQHSCPVGKIISDNKTYIKISAKNGFVYLKSLQLAGKKKLQVEDFLKGFHNICEYRLV